MQRVKRIVCLANSRKLHGRCIAGREWEHNRAGRWTRPVSDRDNKEVSEYERQYEDGSDPQVLDVIDIPMLEPKPSDYQTENWLIDAGDYWKKVGKLTCFDLPDLLDETAPLWIDGYSTWKGLNDYILLEKAASLDHSLRLIHIPRLRILVCKPGEAFGNNKRRVQGRFEHAGKEYALWITDPGFEREYLRKLDGDYETGACFLTISLGEPYGRACYKLIAAVIPGDQ